MLLEKYLKKGGLGNLKLTEGMVIEGEIVAQAGMRDESDFAMEFTSEGLKLARASVPASCSGHAIGDEVQVWHPIVVLISGSWARRSTMLQTAGKLMMKATRVLSIALFITPKYRIPYSRRSRLFGFEG
jgi:hypothetical protein